MICPKVSFSFRSNFYNGIFIYAMRRSGTVSASQQKITVEAVFEANRKGEGLWAIKSTLNKGWGIYSEKKFETHDKVFESKCLFSSGSKASHSIQTGWESHVCMDLPARLINHSCDANVGIKDNNLGAYDFHAVREIQKGEELTWDYGAAEFDSMAFSHCLCGSPNCRKDKIGFRFASQDIKRLYGDYIAGYLRSHKA